MLIFNNPLGSKSVGQKNIPQRIYFPTDCYHFFTWRSI